MKLGIARWGLLALTVTSLAGCLDSGTTTPTTPTATQIPTTKSVVVNVGSMTSSQFADAQFTGQVTGVAINGAGKPVVAFKVALANGNAVTGLGFTSQSSTAIRPGLTNMSFAFAKLVPATKDWPSHWVSYLVVGAPSTTNATGNPGKPSTDNLGDLVDNGDGSYQYTFYRSVGGGAGAIQDIVNNYTGYNATNIKADLGDLTWAPTLTHRVGIHISGNARGTGNNTANAIQTTVAVPLKTPANVFYDFVPATGAAVATSETDPTKQRNVVDVDNCKTCHSKFTFHGGDAMSGVGGARQDTRMCVLCHTDQRKYGAATATVTGTAITAGDKLGADGSSMKDLPIFIHKIHMGEALILQGYSDNVKFNETRYPQDIRNCVKCHSSATGGSNVPQADNWKKVPSRKACGACHDGINWASGQGQSLNGGYPGHVGGAKTDDSLCVLCHTSDAISLVHTPVSPIDPTYATNTHTNSSYIAGYNSTNLPTGALKISFDLNSVTLNASRQPVLKFRFMNNSVAPAAAVVFNAAPASAPSAADVAANNVVELMPNFVGGPNAYFMTALPQDGITAPADFNASSSVYIRNCWNKVLTTCSMTGPDSGGYYALIMTAVSVPTSATMMYGGVGFNDGGATTSMPLTQTNLAAYPINTTKNATTGAVTGWVGGLNVPATPVTKLVSGTLPAGFATQTARRQIVEKARCDNCHNSLGTFTMSSFHGGQRNDPDRCVLCHNPDLNNNGWQVGSNAHVHAIHSAAKRTADNGPPFTWTATADASGNLADGFFKIGYPGILRDCQQCHLPDTVNFGSAANKAQAGSLQFRTAASGAVTAGVTKSPYVTAGTNYGAKYSASLATGVIAEADGTTLVNSPIANACFACHTTGSATSHIRANGGSLYATRDSLAGTSGAGAYAAWIKGGNKLPNNEQCLVCHSAGRLADAEAVHAQTMQ